ncbi:MAG: ABC transporter ATP-binding protein [Bdellovibrionaceae bacterium]|nr:ABC transporter ATP-binding protein [Pseudobdellovibrionaceae bacterium]
MAVSSDSFYFGDVPLLLEIKDLSVHFKTEAGNLEALRHVSFHVDEGEILGVVGESGSGKSVTNLALMGLLPANAVIAAARAQFQGKALDMNSQIELQKLRGSQIAMIFQDPMTALNPSLTVGFQMIETLRAHKNISKEEARKKSISLLERVGIPNAESRLKIYPFELSGGMAQRVMIAMAISCEPKLLIADEPTTALDVTIQKQILDLLLDLQRETGMSILLVSHDLALVKKYAQRVQVMYAGEIAESGQTQEVIQHPRHPYTFGLLKARPSAHEGFAKGELYAIPGTVPSLRARPSGCQFHPRCERATQVCKDIDPPLEGASQVFACHHPLGEA